MINDNVAILYKCILPSNISLTFIAFIDTIIYIGLLFLLRYVYIHRLFYIDVFSHIRGECSNPITDVLLLV